MFICFCNDTATTEIYTLSLHDALPICRGQVEPLEPVGREKLKECEHERAGPNHLNRVDEHDPHGDREDVRSEEHTSELQSRQYLVCRLLLEKKNNITK